MNKDSLGYELGVLLFNFAVDEVDTVYSFNPIYDMMGNLVGILNALHDAIALDDLKEGFLAEAENYGIKKKKALALFEKAKQRVIDF